MSKSKQPIIDPESVEWMRDLGFVPEEEIDEMTGTVESSRRRWDGLPVIQFGKSRWYRKQDIKAYLDRKAEERHEKNKTPEAIL